MIGGFIIGANVIGSFFSTTSTDRKDSNALFMGDENVDTATKITADTTDSNALFME